MGPDEPSDETTPPTTSEIRDSSSESVDAAAPPVPKAGIFQTLTGIFVLGGLLLTLLLALLFYQTLGTGFEFVLGMALTAVLALILIVALLSFISAGLLQKPWRNSHGP